MVEGVDYAFSNPSPTGLAAVGKRFAMRYVGPGTSPKHLTVTEAKALQAAGLSIVLLVEGAADGAAGGRWVGQLHARQARQMCVDRGFPVDRPFYFAVDYNIVISNWPAAREYLRGACDVLGVALVGVYGDYEAMAWAQRDGVASWYFQTTAASSWSNGRVFPGNHVEQYRNGVGLAGGTVDLCRAMTADFGQWPLPKPAAPTEDDMPMYLIETGLPKNELYPNGERVICSTGVHYWWVEDFGPLAELGVPFPTQRVPTAKVREAFGVEVVPGSGGGPAVLVQHTHEVPATGPAVPA